jgi:hypothetical protein
MNRFLQRAFVAAAIAFAAFAVLLAKSFRLQGISWLTSRTLWGSLLWVGFFLVVAFKLAKEWKFRVFVVLSMVAMLELALQGAAWLGVLPGVNTKIKCPYGRVYWTAEGRGNSIRNRFGWHYPEFDLKATNRIAAIGDSFVEAVEVPRNCNHAYLLQERLKQNSPEWAVFGLGTHGTSPAHHLEVLEYAQRHFQPTEAIIYVYLGNDITETSPKLSDWTTNSLIYYDLDASNHLVLNPVSAACREHFVKVMELSHQPFLYCLPTILYSHCMILQSGLSMRDTFKRRRLMASRLGAEKGNLNASVKPRLVPIGINLEPFATNQTQTVTQAMRVLEAELERCKQICDGYGIRLKMVIIPLFPPVFYETQKGRDWTMKIGDYDFLGPELELEDFLKTQQIPVLALGSHLQHRMDVDEIRTLYLSDGTGHFTEKGHRWCADAVYEAFYQPRQP